MVLHPDAWVLKEVFVAALRFGVALELSFRTFRAFPGARSTARGVVLLLLAVTFATVLAVTGDGSQSTASTPPTFELTAGRIQPRLVNGTIWLFTAIAATILWYRLPVDPFHKAILIGFVPYLLFFTIGLNVLDSYGWDLRTLVNYADVGAYIALMAYWARAAWLPAHESQGGPPRTFYENPFVKDPFLTVMLWLLLLTIVVVWHFAQTQRKTRTRFSEFIVQECGQMTDV
ncbi:MAG TPA: hypothetical protein VN461_11755 [Vicinamibacteria bacterium]|nr:hypothetical protein [Vicinamibacteria bacterium]